MRAIREVERLTESDGARRGSGRPRSQRARTAILGAAGELLDDRGLGGLSVDAIAARSRRRAITRIVSPRARASAILRWPRPKGTSWGPLSNRVERADRVSEKPKVTGNGCWRWPGASSNAG